MREVMFPYKQKTAVLLSIKLLYYYIYTFIRVYLFKHFNTMRYYSKISMKKKNNKDLCIQP